MIHTRESLETVQSSDGHTGLRAIGDLFGVKSTGSDTLIAKILEAQNNVPTPSDSSSAVKMTGFDALLDRRRNTEVPLGDDGCYFAPLVEESRIDDVKTALKSFAHQWAFDHIEFVLKLQAFRLYTKGKHLDWIGLNEVVRRYELRMPLTARSISRRLYTAPQKRAYR